MASSDNVSKWQGAVRSASMQSRSSSWRMVQEAISAASAPDLCQAALQLCTVEQLRKMSPVHVHDGDVEYLVNLEVTAAGLALMPNAASAAEEAEEPAATLSIREEDEPPPVPEAAEDEDSDATEEATDGEEEALDGTLSGVTALREEDELRALAAKVHADFLGEPPQQAAGAAAVRADRKVAATPAAAPAAHSAAALDAAAAALQASVRSRFADGESLWARAETADFVEGSAPRGRSPEEVRCRTHIPSAAASCAAS